MSKNGSTGWRVGGGAQPQCSVKCPNCGFLSRRRRLEDGTFGTCSKDHCARLGGSDRVMRKIEPYVELRVRKAKLDLAGDRP